MKSNITKTYSNLFQQIFSIFFQKCLGHGFDPRGLRQRYLRLQDANLQQLRNPRFDRKLRHNYFYSVLNVHILSTNFMTTLRSSIVLQILLWTVFFASKSTIVCLAFNSFNNWAVYFERKEIWFLSQKKKDLIWRKTCLLWD